jgi:anti-sigma factor RsiW
VQRSDAVPDLRRAHDEGAPPAHPGEVTLAAFLDGELPEEQSEDVERHLESCRECRTLIASTARVLADDDALARTTGSHPTVGPRAATASDSLRAVPGRAPWRHAAVAIAASIAVILLVRPDAATPPREATVRSASPAAPGEGLALLPVHAPAAGDSVRAAGLTFTWGASAAERYRLVVTNEEGTPVWSADTRDTSIAFPDSVALRVGALYFWHVDALSAGVAATTRMQRFTVVP